MFNNLNRLNSSMASHTASNSHMASNSHTASNNHTANNSINSLTANPSMPMVTRCLP